MPDFSAFHAAESQFVAAKDWRRVKELFAIYLDADDMTDYGSTLSTELLNQLGQDGWEVCAFDVSLAGRTLLLKRKKV